MAGGPTTVFSERNLASTNGFDQDYNLDADTTVGGNFMISEAYLSRGSGPIYDSDDPYTNMLPGQTQDDTVTGPVQDYVREMLRLGSAAEIKTALMTYGAVATTIYADSGLDSDISSTYYNASDYRIATPGQAIRQRTTP